MPPARLRISSKNALPVTDSVMGSAFVFRVQGL